MDDGAQACAGRAPPLQRVIDYFTRLQRADLARLDEVYAHDARFKDPFNEVCGVSAIRAIFEHMYDTLDQPHFVVAEGFGDERQACLVWEMRFRAPGLGPDWLVIRGSTHLRFDAHGRVTLHRDYWDAAEELYAKLPLLGALMRWLRRRAATPGR